MSRTQKLLWFLVILDAVLLVGSMITREWGAAWSEVGILIPTLCWLWDRRRLDGATRILGRIVERIAREAA